MWFRAYSVIISAVFALALLAGSALAETSSDPAESPYTIEFYTGTWCGPCYRVKHYLAEDDSAKAITLTLADGTTQIFPIKEVDVADPYYDTRYEAGAIDIYGKPRIPQFQVTKDGKRVDAFLFPWPYDSDGRLSFPADFSAAKAIGTRLALGLNLDTDTAPPSN